MPAYVVLLYRQDDEVAAMSDRERAEMLADHRAFQEKHAAAIRAGDALRPAATARRIAVGDGSLAVTDGPWAETKEALGGFYVVEAADLDEAVRIAGDVPTVAGGGVEVRPVMVFE
jgi:hypothetical protein